MSPINVTIRQAAESDTELLASLVRKANKDVAERFNLNDQNAPKHPSFCTAEWIVHETQRGQIYFIAESEGSPAGCVAFESPSPGIAYLNRLSVLPSARRRGIGANLVHHHFRYSAGKGIFTVSIGIIAAFTELKEWYLKLGFEEGATTRFDHLPFDVCYMTVHLPPGLREE